MIKGRKRNNIIAFLALALVAILLFPGCVCPLFSIFERSTGLKVRAGENIDDSVIADELIYPGSLSLVQVIGDIEKILEIVATYGVSFSDEERQALDGLPESIKEQEIGAIAYSAKDNRTAVLSYYEHLTGRGWHIESFSGPGSGIQESKIVIAVKEERRQALMVTGSGSNAFIIFIDFDWDVLDRE